MKSLIRNLKHLYSQLSLATQIILTIILVFISFFVLQLILNSIFFRNFYTNREIDQFKEKLTILNETLDAATEDNHFYHLQDFSTREHALIIYLEDDLTLSLEDNNVYYITISDNNDTGNLYDVILYNYDNTLNVDDTISAAITKISTNYYIFNHYVTSHTERDLSACLDSCININGTISSINEPTNINYLYTTNPSVYYEIESAQERFNIEALPVDNEIISYHSDLANNSVVFLSQTAQNQYIMTIVKLQNTESIVSIVSSYQNYVYLTAVVIIILWSFRIGTIVSKPIKHVETVAKEISQLNFNVEANEFQNKEAASLSNSINAMAKNLSETIDTINAKNDELTHLYEEQTKQVNVKKQLVSSISHELKTPLMIMQVTIQGILDSIIPEKDYKKELANLLEDINKSSAMIQDMLQIYRLEDKENPLELTKVNLTEVTQLYLEDFNHFISQYNLSLETDMNEKLNILADEKLINRVISNYITNAIKYTPENHTISIKITKQNDLVHFSVFNDGAHINKDDLKNIWMPFYRIETQLDDRLSSKGSGVGLYLVSEILKNHNFEFGIKNKNTGVYAYFTAPIAK
ncbi:MAG: ATP-binding protein [Bacillota bacterium]